jgi:N-acylneuraminate cytidylyltransferase
VIGSKLVVAVVPARAGSKSIPDKNLRPVGGRSLVGRAIATALATPEIDRVLLSTDGPAIAEEGRRYGAEIFDRPEDLAGDRALVWDVLVDIRARLRAEGETAEIMVLLEPTAPLREPGDVSACLQRMEAEGLDAVATFTEADPHPYRVWRIEEGRPYTFIAGTVPWQPRQTLPPAYRLNGAVYAFRLDGLVEFPGPAILFGRTGAVLMPAERSLDIDTLTDLEVADALHRRLYPGQ